MTTLSPAERPADQSTEHTQIRGSSLLLTGRILALAINCLTQILIVRYLSTTAYGAWAYCLSVVIAFEAFSALSLEQSLARFVPIYYERGQLSRLLGAVVFSLGVMAALSALFIVPFFAFGGSVSRVVRDPQSIQLLLILLFLIPIDSTDSLFEGLLASFNDARAIFFRKFLLAPCLKIAAVLLIRSASLNVRWLAIAYVIAAGIGVLFYLGNLTSTFRSHGLIRRDLLRHIDIPAWELIAFTLPVMTTTVVSVLNHSVAAMLLGYFRDMTQVAFYRVVYPVATLNQVVFQAFLVLFTPSAAKMFARGDSDGIQRLYWRNAVWMGVLTFPIFILTCGFAAPVVELLFGARYSPSATVLLLIATGYFFSTAIGFNAQALQVVGRVRYITIVNVSAVIANVIANLLVIPRYGAVGAAAVTMGTMVLQNVLNQAALWKIGIRAPERRYWPFFAVLTIAAVMVIGIHFVAKQHFMIAVLLATIATMTVLVAGLAQLDLHHTFPEAQRFPVLRTVCARKFSARYFLMKALDAVVTARRHQHRSWRSDVVTAVSPKRDHYDRVAALARIGARICPSAVNVARQFLLRPEHLPFNTSNIQVVAFGYSVTVFRITLDGRDYALKIFRDSLGYSTGDALSTATEARIQYERVASAYGSGMVLPMSFCLLNAPLLATPAAAALQPFISVKCKDLLRHHSDEEILALAATHPEFREHFVEFAARTLAMAATDDFCLDILGINNVVVVQESTPRIVVMDAGGFRLSELARRFPQRFASLHDALRRIESIASALNDNVGDRRYGTDGRRSNTVGLLPAIIPLERPA